MRLSIHAIAFRIAIFAGVALGCAAQQTELHSAIRIKVQPSRAGDYEAAVKDYVAVLKRAGWDKPGFVWQSATGPSEYVLVRFPSSHADLAMMAPAKLKDVAPELTRIAARIQQCEISREHRVSVKVGGLPRPAEVPKLIRVLSTTVKPGMAEAYIDLVNQEVVPALKSAGAPGFTLYRVSYGDSRNRLFSATPLSGWSDLDGEAPLLKALGREKYRQLMAKRNTMIVDLEANIYRFRPDLSYVPDTAAPRPTDNR